MGKKLMNGLWIALLVCSVLGMLNALVLLDVHYGFLTGNDVDTGNNIFCGEGAGCDIVNQSSYSTIGGIPNSLTGLIGYGILTALLLAYKRLKLSYKHMSLLLGVLVLGAFVLSYVGLYIQKYVIGAFCKYCVLNDILIAVMLGFCVVNIAVLYKKKLSEYLF